jgi:predicted Ser/Thr protein kinase
VNTVGPYELLSELGSGGFGRVYRARHGELGWERAVKVATDPEFVRQLRREGEVLARLRHPRIVEVFDMNTSHDPPYVVMEYVEGGDLRHLLEGGPLPVARAVEIMLDVLEALEHAHSHGVIHRDIKPANILLDREGRAKVSDFGLGRVVEEVSRSGGRVGSVRSGSGDSAGTLKYMSPEQLDPERLRGERLDHRSDLYSVGLVLYEMLTGRFPAGIRPPMPSEVRPDLPTALDAIFAGCVAGDRQDRYGNAGEVAVGMRRLPPFGNAGPCPAGGSSARALEQPPPRSFGKPAAPLRLCQTLDPPGDHSSVLFTRGGHLVCADPGLVYQWDTPTWQRSEYSPVDHEGMLFYGHAIACTRDGRLIVAGQNLRDKSDRGRSSTLIWYPGDTSPSFALPGEADEEDLHAVQFARDGEYLAAMCRSREFNSAGALWLWQVEARRRIGGLALPTFAAWALSPDHKWVVFADHSNVAEVARMPQGDSAPDLSGHLGEITALRFSADGRLLATGSQDGGVCIWSFPRGKCIRELPNQEMPVKCLAFSHDNVLLACGGESRAFAAGECEWGGVVKLWDVGTGSHVQTIVHDELGDGPCCAFSPGDRLLAVSSGGVSALVWSFRKERE